MLGFSLVVVSRGCSLVQCVGFFLQVLLLFQSTGSRTCELQWLQFPGLVAPQHVRSSQIRDRTRVSCIVQVDSLHWATREVRSGENLEKKKKIIGSFTEASQALLEPAAKSLQLCPTLCDPMDCSVPGFSIHGIFQARVLEWGAIAFSILEPEPPQNKSVITNLVFNILLSCSSWIFFWH